MHTITQQRIFFSREFSTSQRKHLGLAPHPVYVQTNIVKNQECNALIHRNGLYLMPFIKQKSKLKHLHAYCHQSQNICETSYNITINDLFDGCSSVIKLIQLQATLPRSACMFYINVILFVLQPLSSHMVFTVKLLAQFSLICIISCDG